MNHPLQVKKYPRHIILLSGVGGQLLTTFLLIKRLYHEQNKNEKLSQYRNGRET